MSTPNRGPAVESHALAKNYGKHTALQGIDLSIPTGSVFGMIGPNGAGKTTTMRLLLDIIRPTSGELRVLGESPKDAGPALRRRIGYLPGELRLDGRMKGSDLLNYFASLSGEVAPGAITALAKRLDLDLSRQVRTLSKGNKQKLGLVQAFMHAPPLLVLDEPTSGLDPLVQQEFHTMVREATAAGQTVFLSSHVLSEIELTASRVAILRNGEIVAVASVAELRSTAQRKVRIGVAHADVAALTTSLKSVAGLANLAVSDGRAHNNHASLTATLEGSVDAFVHALSAHSILDLVVEEPDLEESVLHFYNTEDVR